MIDHVARLAEGFGWTAESTPDPDELLICWGEHRLMAVVKVLRNPLRSLELRAHLADTYLRARTAATATEAHPMPILAAPSISEKMARELREYAAKHLPGVAWALLDGHGRTEFHNAPLQPGPHAPSVPPPEPLIARTARKEKVDPFTDLNRWMLKVLLAPLLEERFLSAPRQTLAHTLELAKAAEVSEPHAKRLVRRLRQLGFLETRPALHLVRIKELLDQWSANSRSAAGDDVPARLLLPSRDARATLIQNIRKTLGDDAARGPRGSRVALGLFAAADLLGLGHVSGTATHLYVEGDDPEGWKRLGLVPTASQENAQFFIRRAAWPESLFRGAITRDGAPFTDALQTWLDVQNHPARGAEQAGLLATHALAPLLTHG